VRREFVWAALDCPGAFAVGYPNRGATLLGRLAVQVESIPRVEEGCIVVGWPLGEDGRKLYAGTALFRESGEVLAWGRATWILPRS
jgi:predicted amidohydrolase